MSVCLLNVNILSYTTITENMHSVGCVPGNSPLTVQV